MIDRRRFIATAGIGLAAPFILRGTARAAAEVTLRVQHFLPRTSNTHENFLQLWASELQEASEGRIEVQILVPLQRPAAPQLYDRVREGKVEIALTTVAESPGRFPRLEVFHLPFVAARRGSVNSQAVQEFAQKHPEEFLEVQPLVVWAEDHGVIHAKKLISNMDELKGARICPPTRACGRALEALGAVAVSVRAEHLSEAFTQNVLDGAVAPWDMTAPLMLDELTGFHTEIPNTPTLSSSVSMLVMNKERFRTLPQALRQILMDKSGQYAARMAGQAYDARNATAVALVQGRSHPVVTIAEEEKARWIAATQPVIEDWVAEGRGRGLDGNALLAEARALVTRYDTPAGPVGQPVARGPVRTAPLQPPAAPPAGELAPPTALVAPLPPTTPQAGP